MTESGCRAHSHVNEQVRVKNCSASANLLARGAPVGVTRMQDASSFVLAWKFITGEKL